MSDNQVTLEHGLVNPASWSFADKNQPFPLQQHPVYALSLQAFGSTASQVTFSLNGNAIGHAVLAHRKLFGAIRLTTLFRGPTWFNSTISDEQRLMCLKALRSSYSPWRWNFLAVLPEEAEDTHHASFYKKAGLKRVMTGFSTAWLDLRQSEEDLRRQLKGKWRNQLVKAEKAAISVSIGGRKPHQYEWLLDKEQEQRDSRRYQATPLGLVPAFLNASTPKSATGVLSVSALHERRKIAGALFLLHGNSATYHIGWAGDEARALNAQNRVLWEGMCTLKSKGISFLDLGGLNTADLAGIARFKLGTGAQPHTLAGAFI